MTEHSTEELKRQYEAAKERARQADDAMRKARKAYIDAQCADLLAGFEAQGGVIGKTRVRVLDWTGAVNRRAGPFLVVGAEGQTWGSGVVLKLAKIKKDGTTSNAPSGQHPEGVAILPEDQE